MRPEPPLFHVAPRGDAASITAHGINHTRGVSAYSALDFEPGNYLFTELDAALAYRAMREREERDEYGRDAEPYDVWQVTVVPAGLRPDQFADDPSGLGRFSLFTAAPIPAAHVARLPA